VGSDVVLKTRPAPAGAGTRVDWRAVCTFYAMACGFSWPLLWVRDRHPDLWAAWGLPGVVQSWLPAFGPLLAGIAARWLFRRTHTARIGLTGTSRVRSLGFALILVATMTVAGLPDRPHLTGLLYSGAFLVYGFCEETGWRGFLQDALHPLPEPQRYVLIGLLWGVWHFTTFLSGSPRQVGLRLALLSLLWIGGSWGIGAAVEATRSLTVAALFHVTFNLFRSLSLGTTLTVLVPCVVAWVWLLRTWPAPPADENANSTAQDSAGV